jgi:Nickel responsive protein SCO4226-like
VAVYVVERYWSGVSAVDVAALAERLDRAARAAGIGYLGSVLLVDDDVVQCRFDSPDIEAVRRVNDVAGARYDRILLARTYPA